MTKDNDFVAISINDSSPSYPLSAKLFCNLCNCNLSLLNAEKEEWICTRCNVSYFPNKGEKVKRANRFETPGPETDKHGNITGEKMPIVQSLKTIKNFLQPMEKKNFRSHLKKYKDMTINVKYNI